MQGGPEKIKSFKDDIRKTFIFYALVPVVIITFLSYFISFSIWYRTVVGRNCAINEKVSERIETIVSAFEHKAMELSRRNDIIPYLHNASLSRVTLYEEIYGFVNTIDIECDFFIFDRLMQPIISSSSIRPHYAVKGIAFNRGVSKRMTDYPDVTVLVRENSHNPDHRSLSIGKAVVWDSTILGFVVFDLNERDLIRIVNQDFSVNIVVTDQPGYVISGTNQLVLDEFGKIDGIFRNKSGFIRSSSNSHYVSNSNILDDNISIYTITTIGYFESIFMLAGIILLVIFLMISFVTSLWAKKIAVNKTKAIDEIIEAIGNVKKGNLDTLLHLNTNDEFQIIAESYNAMLSDIKRLIENNKEKAQQNIISEIKQLESQFNPHFLFNTLEIIKYMSKTDPQQVHKIVIAFSSLLRYSINNSISIISLKEDLEYTKNYLLIQKYRFEDHFSYTFQADNEAFNCVVPKLITQPIIENAIHYGFNKKKTLRIEIRVKIVGDKLIIVISDDGIGMDSDQVKYMRNILKGRKNNSVHIGLFNVHRKIQLMYGEFYGINLESEKGQGTVVRLTLPVKKKDNEYGESFNSRR